MFIEVFMHLGLKADGNGMTLGSFMSSGVMPSEV
jgi:hypothetical protein